MMRWVLPIAGLLIVAGGVSVFWDAVPPIRGYLAPLPPAVFTTSEVVMRAPAPTPEYTGPVDTFTLQKFKFLGHTRRWHAYVPGGNPSAAVMLLHGSDQNSAAMIDMWKAAADEHGLALIAPQSRESDRWSQIKDGGRFMTRVAAHAEDHFGSEFENWFIFGHAAGAVHALTLMQSNSIAWDAVAVHGGGPSPDRVAPAVRAIPYRVYVGDANPFVSVAFIEGGARAIAAAGHPSEMIVVKDHTHRFYDIGPDVADDAAVWFLQQIAR